jgi:hypothetical protein
MDVDEPDDEEPDDDDIVMPDSGEVVPPKLIVKHITPAEHYKKFRCRLLFLLPQLQTLDGVNITAQDKVKAANVFANELCQPNSNSINSKNMEEQ